MLWMENVTEREFDIINVCAIRHEVGRACHGCVYDGKMCELVKISLGVDIPLEYIAEIENKYRKDGFCNEKK